MVSLVHAGGYDEATGLRNMMFAGASYCSAFQGSSNAPPSWTTLSDDCVQQSPDFTITGTYFNSTVDGTSIIGISHNQQIIVVAFKGTDPNHMTDIIIDAKNIFTFPTVCELQAISGPAHQGFCYEYQSLKYAGVFDAVVSLAQQFPDYQVIATGHSLGGAIAMLLALDLMSSKNIPVSCYTYGQPRTVASDLALRYYSLLESLPSSEMYRVTHFKDVVPHVPKCKTDGQNTCAQDNLHGYHTGYQIHYDESMQKYTQCTPVDGADCNEVMPVGVTDHLYYFGRRISQVCCPPPVPSPIPPSDDDDDDDNDDTMMMMTS